MRIFLSTLCIEFLILASSYEYEHPCRRSVCPYHWSAWSGCSCSCGSGCTRTRTGLTDPDGCCPRDSTTETEACNTDPSLCLHGGSQNPYGCSCTSGWTGTCCENGKWQFFGPFIPSRSIRQIVANFLELNSKEVYRSSEKENCCLVFTSSTKRENMKFHVVVVQRRQRNVQKSVIHVQSCCFVNLRPCLHGVGDPGLVG